MKKTLLMLLALLTWLKFTLCKEPTVVTLKILDNASHLLILYVLPPYMALYAIVFSTVCLALILLISWATIKQKQPRTNDSTELDKDTGVS